MSSARREAKSRVVGRGAFKKDKGYATAAQLSQSVPDQRGAHPLPLVLGQYADRAEDLYINQPFWPVEQVSGEQDVTDDFIAIDRDKREPELVGKRPS